jgi:hypothetical protein
MSVFAFVGSVSGMWALEEYLNWKESLHIQGWVNEWMRSKSTASYNCVRQDGMLWKQPDQAAFPDQEPPPESYYAARGDGQVLHSHPNPRMENDAIQP